MSKIVLLNPMLHPSGQELLAARAEIEIVPADSLPRRLAQALGRPTASSSGCRRALPRT